MYLIISYLLGQGMIEGIELTWVTLSQSMPGETCLKKASYR